MGDLKLARVVGTLAVGIMTGGCWADIGETRVQGPPRPIVSETVRKTPETEERPAIVKAVIATDSVDVDVTIPSACRNVSSIPTERVDEVQRTVKEREKQTWNLLGAALLAGSGAYLAFGKCTSVDSSSSGAPCSRKEQSGQEVVGYVIMGTAALPLTLFFVNAARAANGRETVRLPDERRPDAWQACGTSPARNRTARLKLGERTLSARTSDAGRATFDLAQVDDFGETVPSSALLTVEGGADTTIDLRSTRAADRWAQQAEKARAARVESERLELENATWTRADAGSCRGPQPVDPDATSAACDLLSAFLERFPESSRARAAQEALSIGRGRLPKLRADADRRKRDEDAARRRAEQAARDREAAERGRRAAACRTACVAQCKPRADFVACTQTCQSSCGQ
jgi:hypothetical protein